MAQEGKHILLIDLCARLPYHVIVNYRGANVDLTQYIRSVKLENCKPYLRSMSSMTEEEEIYYNTVYTRLKFYEKEDWLNAHHFDYRIDPSTGKTLIESGFALEAPEWMYNKEESEEESENPIPKTVDEAVKTLAKIVSEEDRDYLLKNGAISMHDSLGRWIRNEWGLWTGSELKNELMNMNKGLNHPDDMSNYIIEEFVKYWNNKI